MSSEKAVVLQNPDGSLSYLGGDDDPSSGPAPPQPASGAGPGITWEQRVADAAGVAPAPRTSAAPTPQVTCPSCRRLLQPPPGAPVFGCPCGARLSAPAPAPPSGYSAPAPTPPSGYSAPAYPPPHAAHCPPAAWPGSAETTGPHHPAAAPGTYAVGLHGGAGPPAGGHPPGPHPYPLPPPAGAGGGPWVPPPPAPGQRHVRCPRCHTLLSSEAVALVSPSPPSAHTSLRSSIPAAGTAVTMCGVCSTTFAGDGVPVMQQQVVFPQMQQPGGGQVYFLRY